MMLSYAHEGLGGPEGAYCMTTSSYESLSHAKWDGTYHVVFIPKGQNKALYGKIRRFLGPALRDSVVDDKGTFMESVSGREGMQCLRLVLRKRRCAPLASSRSSSTPKARRSQASSSNVTDDPGSP